MKNLKRKLLLAVDNSYLSEQDKSKLEKNINDYCEKLSRGEISLDQLRSELSEVTGRKRDRFHKRDHYIGGAALITVPAFLAIFINPLVGVLPAGYAFIILSFFLHDKNKSKKLADESYQPKNEIEKKLQLYLQFKKIIKSFIENQALADKPSSLNTTSFFQHRSRDNDQQDSIVIELQTPTLTRRNPA